MIGIFAKRAFQKVFDLIPEGQLKQKLRKIWKRIGGDDDGPGIPCGRRRGNFGASNPNSGNFGASNPCPRGGTGAKFADNAKLQDHYMRHGPDFGASSAAEYESMADGFLTGTPSASTLDKTRPNGDIVKFDPVTNEFGVVSGITIRTYYKPDPAIHGLPTNLDYFNAQ